MSLEKRLRALRESSAERIPEPAKAVMNRATEDLRASGILERIPRPGTEAPSFGLPASDAPDREITLSALTAEGPVVLTFFRGSW